MQIFYYSCRAAPDRTTLALSSRLQRPCENLSEVSADQGDKGHRQEHEGVGSSGDNSKSGSVGGVLCSAGNHSADNSNQKDDGLGVHVEGERLAR